MYHPDGRDFHVGDAEILPKGPRITRYPVLSLTIFRTTQLTLINYGGAKFVMVEKCDSVCLQLHRVPLKAGSVTDAYGERVQCGWLEAVPFTLLCKMCANAASS